MTDSAVGAIDIQELAIKAALSRSDCWQFNPDVRTLHADGKRGMTQLGVQAVTSRLNVKLPAVPRTGDYVAGQHATSQRSPRMRAYPVEGVESAIHVEHSHDSASHDEFAPFSQWNFRNARNPISIHSHTILGVLTTKFGMLQSRGRQYGPFACCFPRTVTRRPYRRLTSFFHTRFVRLLGHPVSNSRD